MCVVPYSSHAKAAKTPGDLTFDDSKDDLMDALGFDSDKNSPKKKETSLWANKERLLLCFSLLLSHSFYCPYTAQIITWIKMVLFSLI